MRHFFGADDEAKIYISCTSCSTDKELNYLGMEGVVKGYCPCRKPTPHYHIYIMCEGCGKKLKSHLPKKEEEEKE